jgi:hypothetical protein
LILIDYIQIISILARKGKGDEIFQFIEKLETLGAVLPVHIFRVALAHIGKLGNSTTTLAFFYRWQKIIKTDNLAIENTLEHLGNDDNVAALLEFYAKAKEWKVHIGLHTYNKIMFRLKNGNKIKVRNLFRDVLSCFF